MRTNGTDELTCECISRRRDQARAVFALLRDAGVEVFNSFFKPHANDEEGTEAYGIAVRKMSVAPVLKIHTNKKAEESDPCRRPLKDRGVEERRRLSRHLV